MIEITNLTKKFHDKVVLKNISLSFPEKGLVVIEGESGCGKTTFLNILSFNDFSYEGTVSFNGKVFSRKDVSAFKAQNIYYHTADHNMLDYLTVEENFHLQFDGFEEKIKAYLYRYHLDYLWRQKVQTLSSGERQKVSLFFALIRKAPITILDEPLSNIDSVDKNALKEELKQLSKECLVILSAHKQDALMEADVHLKFSNHELKGNFFLETEKIVNPTVSLLPKRKMIGTAFKTELKKWFGLGTVFDVAVYGLFLLSLIFLNGFLIREKDIWDYYIRNTSVGVYQISQQLQDRYNAVTMYEEWDHALGYPILQSEQDGKLSTLFGSTSIRVTDSFLFNGRKVKLVDKTVYLSDYLYDYYSFSSSSFFGFESPHDERIYPEGLPDPSGGTIPYSGVTTYYPLDIEIYQTNYRQMMEKLSTEEYQIFITNYCMPLYMNQATFDEICQFRYDGIWCQSTTGNAVHILCYDEENNRKYGQEGVMQENAIMDSVNYEFFGPSTYLWAFDNRFVSDELPKVGSVVDLSVVLNGKTYQRTLTYQGSVYYQNYASSIPPGFEVGTSSLLKQPPIVFVSSNVYEEIYQALDYGNKKNFLQAEEKYTIDFEQSDYQSLLEAIVNQPNAFYFMEYPLVQSVFNQTGLAPLLFKIAFGISSTLWLVSVGLYGFWYVKKEIRTMTFLTNKGMVKTDVYKLVFYPKIVRNIVLLALSVGLFFLVKPYLILLVVQVI